MLQWGPFWGKKKNSIITRFSVVVIAKYDSAAQIQSHGPNITSSEAKS